MKVQRGDVVLVDHPFSEASGSKIRPVLVVQNDTRNALLTETIVVLISKNVQHVHTDPTQLLIEIATPDGQAPGLNSDSAVKCGKLFTLHEGLIRRRIGSLSVSLMQQVNDYLKTAMALP
jgi:mRNA-degrading endonuclease toxin of MazEF toxin-antitoxin module